jgi:hypothetical protein
MNVELRSLRGQLTDEQVGWIVDLYGPVDAKYRSAQYVMHQFVENPFGWSANVFAVADGRAVGHCGVVPVRARRASDTFVAGKLEALAVDGAHRGRRADDGGSVATDILTRLYPFAVENGMELVFGLAPPPVARIHVRAGCHLVPTNAPAYTSVTDVESFAGPSGTWKRRIGARGLGVLQRTLLAPFPHSYSLEQPQIADAGIASAVDDPAGWTVSGADSWDWFVGSGVLRVLKLDDGTRALVRLDESHPTTVQILSWSSRRGGLPSAFRVLAAAAELARAHDAPTLRFQPWRGGAEEAVLARACALAGFVARPEAELLLYPDGPQVDEMRFSPFFYVTF